MPPMTFRGTREELQPIEDALFRFLQSYAVGVPDKVVTSFDALKKCLPESNGCLWRGAPDVLTGLQAIQGIVERVDKQSKLELSSNELAQLAWAFRAFQVVIQTSHPVPPASRSLSGQRVDRRDRSI